MNRCRTTVRAAQPARQQHPRNATVARPDPVQPVPHTARGRRRGSCRWPTGCVPAGRAAQTVSAITPLSSGMNTVNIWQGRSCLNAIRRFMGRTTLLQAARGQPVPLSWSDAMTQQHRAARVQPQRAGAGCLRRLCRRACAGKEGSRRREEPDRTQATIEIGAAGARVILATALSSASTTACATRMPMACSTSTTAVAMVRPAPGWISSAAISACRHANSVRFGRARATERESRYNELWAVNADTGDTGVLGTGTTTPTALYLPAAQLAAIPTTAAKPRATCSAGRNRLVRSFRLEGAQQREEEPGAQLLGIGNQCPSTATSGCSSLRASLPAPGSSITHSRLTQPPPGSRRASTMRAHRCNSAVATTDHYLTNDKVRYAGSAVDAQRRNRQPLPAGTGRAGVPGATVALAPENQYNYFDLTGSYTVFADRATTSKSPIHRRRRMRSSPALA